VTLGERGQGDQRVLRGGAPARDGHVLAGVPRLDVGPVHVGDPVEHLVGVLLLADGAVAVAAERVGVAPRAGGVDDGRGGECGAARRTGHVQSEGHLVPPDGHEAVATGAGHAHDPAVEPHLDVGQRREALGQRGQVALNPLTPGRVRARVRTGPARLGQQLLRDRVDQLGPRRKEPHVPPLEHRSASSRARLQHNNAEAPRLCLGGRGETRRPGADDDDGQTRVTLDRRGGGSRGGGRHETLLKFIDGDR
jgi:hypothetical protein